ncbi:hypothetical protein [Paraburkholderia bannensis]|uniref:hypothetical protein n=1 Tax=Paraburkholderia bannensis TaxID=765414 RepID=UPI002AAF33E4|nr:hypothetical protein [Paraburkholderia bannensis]
MLVEARLNRAQPLQHIADFLLAFLVVDIQFRDVGNRRGDASGNVGIETIEVLTRVHGVRDEFG